jgi:heme a synthase
MSRTTEHAWLTRFAWVTAASTLCLIGLGGLVTSHGAGMAVPDWPTTYGYNMFLFPIHLWTGGIFYEHTHRLVASGVGLLTSILAAWLWFRESRAILRWLGVLAFFLVVLQGVLGGLRVTLFKDEIGIFHATLGQVFFVLLTAIALFSSRLGERWVSSLREEGLSNRVRLLLTLATTLIFAQLILGASMRHQHAGLAIPDFPLAYGQLWPPTDPVFLDNINRQRLGAQDFKPVTAFHIVLHMSHRIGALLIVVAVGAAAWFTRREQGRGSLLSRMTLAWLVLIGVQASLGAATVWTNKAADVATAHVLAGALSLLVGAMASILSLAAVARSAARATVSQSSASMPSPSIAQPRPVS